MYILGQICGIVGTVITVVQPQFEQRMQILFCTVVVNAMSALNYLFVGGAGSAVFLCLIAVVQGLVSLVHEHRRTDIAPWETVLFFFLYMGAGFFGLVTSEGFVWAINAHNLLELLPIVGALMLMLSVFAKTEQNTRLFLFLNGAVWAVYCAVIGATSFFTSLAAMGSSAIAMWKYRNTNGKRVNI